MKIRKFDPDIDINAVNRIWKEIRWLEVDDDAKHMASFLSQARVLVAEINGDAECMAVSTPGDINHLESDISMAAVTAVSTSLVARKQGLASKLTARLVAEDAEAGCETSALGMFDQGYYNRLGFGTGPYEHTISFDPADLKIDDTARPPIRLKTDDFKDVYQAMLNRWRGHGGVRLFQAGHVKAELAWTKSPFGLGYRNAAGELTHFIWGAATQESGPFNVKVIAFQNTEQLLELMALLAGIGDQAMLVRLTEPGHLQLQDFLKTPFRRHQTSKGAPLGSKNVANAFWQLRINDVEKCLSNTHLPGRKGLHFNLSLADPITKYLEPDQPWQGVAGDYTIYLGEDCEASKGHKAGLPLLKAGIAGFSRLWLGSANANALAIAGELSASDDLLRNLEMTLSLPLPKIGWDF